MTASWPAAVFNRLYASTPDPWRFRTSRYEAAKYRATMAALGRRRYAAGYEPGCSIGVLTASLAQRCTRLLATDCAPAALHAARAARPRSNIRFQQATLPRDWPRGRRFDLIVLSELLYFLSPADLRRLARKAAASLRHGGVILLVNYTGRTDTPLTGARAAAGFSAASGLQRQAVRRGRYRIDRLMPAGPGKARQGVLF